MSDDRHTNYCKAEFDHYERASVILREGDAREGATHQDGRARNRGASMSDARHTNYCKSVFDNLKGNTLSVSKHKKK